MAAYVITRVNVTDPDQYEKYKALSPAAVAESGGRFIVRGGDSVTLEGPEDNRRQPDRACSTDTWCTSTPWTVQSGQCDCTSHWSPSTES